MSGINFIGQDEIKRRKTVSDAKNNTDAVTFTGSDLKSSRGAAYRNVRKYLDDKELADLCKADSISEFEEMFNSLGNQ